MIIFNVDLSDIAIEHAFLSCVVIKLSISETFMAYALYFKLVDICFIMPVYVLRGFNTNLFAISSVPVMPAAVPMMPATEAAAAAVV